MTGELLQELAKKSTEGDQAKIELSDVETALKE